jgi:hypothetical protein
MNSWKQKVTKGKNIKKLILAATILAIVGMNLQTAKAGDREWATVGKVLTGVAAVGILANELDVHPHYSVSYSYSEPAHCPPQTVVYAPAPAVVCAPAPRIVYYRAAPVIYRAPVYYAPRVVSYRDRDCRDFRGEHDSYRDGHRDGYRR